MLETLEKMPVKKQTNKKKLFSLKYFINIWMWVEPSGGGEHVTCMLSTVRPLSSIYEDLHGILSLEYAGKQGSQVKIWTSVCAFRSHRYNNAGTHWLPFKAWLECVCFWCNTTEAVTEHLSAGGSVAPQNRHCCSSLRREACEECVCLCVT